MTPSPPVSGRLIAAAGAALAGAAAIALVRSAGRSDLGPLAGVWAGAGVGPSGRRVEVALGVRRNAGSGLFPGETYELALRTKEQLGKTPLERSTSPDDPAARVAILSTEQGRVVAASERIRLEHSSETPDALDVLVRGYWVVPERELRVRLERVRDEEVNGG